VLNILLDLYIFIAHISTDHLITRNYAFLAF